MPQRDGVWVKLFGEVRSSTFCYALTLNTAALVAPRNTRHHGLLVRYTALNFRGASEDFAPRGRLSQSLHVRHGLYRESGRSWAHEC